MMNLITLPKSFWGYALESAACMLNMVPTKKVERMPYEIWHRKAPKLSYLRVWGCEALVKRDAPDKLNPRSIKCIFVGYPKETMVYYFYYQLENKIFVAQNVEFFEKNLIVQEAKHNEVAPTEVEPQNVGVPIRRSARIPQAPDRYGFYVDVEEHELGDLNKPPNYKVALSDPEFDKWLEAMNTKMQSMKDNQVWILVDLPPNGRTIGNYEETFSPIADIRDIRILLAISTYYDYEIWQIDVKTVFLNGHLSEDVYMVQPEGFVDPKHPNKVCKLQRSIYGLKQASRTSGSSVALVVLYVDDILLMGNNVTMLQEVKSWLCKCFCMKDLGEEAYILGIKIIRDRSKRLIALSQIAYLEKTLKKFRIENSKKGYTPMIENPDYSKSQGAKTPSEVDNSIRPASRWLRNKPSGSITTWEDLKTKFLSKYCPPARTAKKMEEINNF
ncbi:retrotransposon protein, putative, ty1-copia subclass [Tanacetum coccineum]